MIGGAGFGVQPQGSPQEWGSGQGPDGPPQEQGFKGLAPWWGFGAQPQALRRSGAWGNAPIALRRSRGSRGWPLHKGNNNNKDNIAWGLGQRPRGVRGTAPMPSAGARDH
ncbi:uncharacterized protein EI90DRAFT_3022152 [Cantharellus anzutake]|uniref:uncharacterized protein n=1 Tax=Cantharellus anzutake TaxID=1750568 RepID=UPI0019039F3E|nr:uncharacterized protein EI90DRAFT_3022152 [Cantharellus anzutake]KAF8314892.1 hypothetical protein EI90DRAFT_3022152 [Cantharellus anzutake]